MSVLDRHIPLEEHAFLNVKIKGTNSRVRIIEQRLCMHLLVKHQRENGSVKVSLGLQIAVRHMPADRHHRQSSKRIIGGIHIVTIDGIRDNSIRRNCQFYGRVTEINKHFQVFPWEESVFRFALDVTDRKILAVLVF